MCGRFAQFNPVAVLKDLYGIDEVTCDGIPSYNIAPTREVLAIIRHNGNRLGNLHWGLVPFWAKELKPSKGMINARAETLKEKPAFKGLYRKRRCLIPADGFYEWKQDGSRKIPYYIYATSGENLAFAGLWDIWKNDSDEVYHSCTIITREAVGRVCELHHRMPAILSKEMIDNWLDPGMDDVRALDSILASGCISKLDFHEVDPAVNSVKVNSADCIRQNV